MFFFCWILFILLLLKFKRRVVMYPENSKKKKKWRHQWLLFLPAVPCLSDGSMNGNEWGFGLTRHPSWYKGSHVSRLFSVLHQDGRINSCLDEQLRQCLCLNKAWRPTSSPSTWKSLWLVVSLKLLLVLLILDLAWG